MNPDNLPINIHENVVKEFTNGIWIYKNIYLELGGKVITKISGSSLL